MNETNQAEKIKKKLIGVSRGRTDERTNRRGEITSERANERKSVDVSTRASIDHLSSSSRVADLRLFDDACVPTHSDRLDFDESHACDESRTVNQLVAKNKPQKARCSRFLTPVGFEPTLFRKGMFHPRAREKS